MEQIPVTWKGPYAWPGFEKEKGNEDLQLLPEVEGVYVFTFEFKAGQVAFWPGHAIRTTERMDQHRRNCFEKGKYHVFDLEYALKGERQEIWSWQEIDRNPTGFTSEIREAVKKQLTATRIFIAEITDEEISNIQISGSDNAKKRERFRERLEAAFIIHLENEKAYWSDLMDKKGMGKRPRLVDENPIKVKNNRSCEIYGLPDIFEL